MPIRWRITHIRRDSDTNKISKVKCDNFFDFSVANVISNIENNIFQYYVQQLTPPADVHVVKESDGTKYIRTDKDCVPENNLENLPLF